MEKSKSDIWLGRVMATIGILAMVSFAIILFTHNTPKEHKYTCKACGREFTNSYDTKSIINNGMCENCYDDYKLDADLKDAVRRIQENEGR